MNATLTEHSTMNTAVGSMALYSNTTGFGNTSGGRLSLANNITGSNNTVFGTKVLYYNTSGSANTATGLVSLYFNTTGSENTACGFGSLYYNNGGSDNTVIGMFGGINNTTGIRNSGLGYYSMVANINGTGNISLGQQSLASNVTGNYNTAVGIYALAYTNSDYNTAVGYNTGGSYYFDNSTFMGDYAYPEGNAFVNCLAMGADARVNASNKYVFGKWSVTSIGGYANWTTFSDGRFKRNVQENVPGLDFINRLEPVMYNLDTHALEDHFNRNGAGRASNVNAEITLTESETGYDNVVYTGFIAQDVVEAARLAGYDFSGVDKPSGENDFFRLRYEEFVVPLVKAIQELNQRKEANIRAIHELEQRIDNLEKKK